VRYAENTSRLSGKHIDLDWRRYRAGNSDGKHGAVDTHRSRHWGDPLDCPKQVEMIHLLAKDPSTGTPPQIARVE
jgi:hypothetical protein